MPQTNDETYDQGRDGADPGTCGGYDTMKHKAAQRGCVVGGALLCSALCLLLV